MKLKYAISALALTLTLSAAAQSTQKYVSQDNGNDWSALDHDQKVWYIAGFNNGYFASILLSDAKPIENNLTIGQQVLAIDQCYSDERNLKLPIVACFAFALGQSKGLSPEQLETSLAKMRKAF